MKRKRKRYDKFISLTLTERDLGLVDAMAEAEDRSRGSMVRVLIREEAKRREMEENQGEDE